MGYIHCCSALRRCKTYRITPNDGFFIATLNFLKCCPECGHSVVLVARISFMHEYSEVRKTNQKALKLFDRLKASILYEVKREFKANLPNVSNPLKYYDNGVKKCYSSLSSLKIGLFESLNLHKATLEKVDLKNFKKSD